MSIVTAALAVGACSSDSNLAGGPASSSAPARSASAFCDLARLQTESPAPDPFAPDLTPSQVQDAIDEVADELQALATVAPDEIAGDVDVLVEGFADLDDALAEHDYDLDAMDAADVTLPMADDPEFAEIGERIAQHLAEACGVAA